MKKLTTFFIVIALCMVVIHCGLLLYVAANKTREVIWEGVWYCLWWMAVSYFCIWIHINEKKNDQQYK
jgi:hypothetical protein